MNKFKKPAVIVQFKKKPETSLKRIPKRKFNRRARKYSQKAKKKNTGNPGWSSI